MSKRKTKPEDRYTLYVEWSDEDQLYIGRCPELFVGGVHGKDRAKVYAELCEVVQEWIEIDRQDGRKLPPALPAKKFSGKFVLRVRPEIHKALALRAITAGKSLNAYCAEKLAAAT